MVEILTPAECIGIDVLRLDTLLELPNFREDPAQLLFEVAHAVNDFTFLQSPQSRTPREFCFAKHFSLGKLIEYEIAAEHCESIWVIHNQQGCDTKTC